MTEYQSINIILEDDEKICNVTELCPKSFDTPSELASPDYSMDEETSIIGKSMKESRGKTSVKQKPYLSACIVLSTLFLGFAVGFSIGFHASRKGYFTERTINVMDDESVTEKQQKVWEFLDTFIFRNSPTSSLTEESMPLLKFPFQGGGTPRPIVYLNRPDAYALLIDTMSGSMSEYATDFFLISSGLDAQLNQGYCGVASAVAVLNSLRFLKSTISDDGVDIPIDPNYAPYLYATQRDIFNNCTEKTVISHIGGGPGIDGLLTPPYGLSMPQIAGLLRCHLNTTTDSGIGWTVQEQYVDKSHITIGKVRFDIKNALSDPNSRVLVNFDRSVIGQDGNGHWSPVGSYSDKQDAFLVLDVAKYKYPPVWIPTERLFDALATYDDCGSWNFPNGQAILSQEQRTTHTKEGYAATLDKLGCTKTLRGYIIVTRT